jgi:GT2 family glycosyltransferase
MASALLRIFKQLPLALLSLAYVPISWAALWLTDLFFFLFGRRRLTPDTRPNTASASVVIPNWNGRDLLAKYLPSVVEALRGNPANEIIVVDNGSTDGSAEFVRRHFPEVTLLALPQNLGFGGGSNAGFRAAKNDIVVLLNSDMRVDAGFLQPLLDGFTDERVFAVSCQIFFSDPNRKREETGLTQGWWSHGGLRVRHYDEPQVFSPFPCFYAGGGSSAFDRRKFLSLGGFDPLLRPFYLEDTDLGYMAWKRGWKVLYQPASKVWHEHRGTIGKKFSRAYIDGVIGKNFVLFCWKNIHQPAWLAAHFYYAWSGALLGIAAGESLERAGFDGLARAFLQLPGALRARWRARSLAAIGDEEAFRRPMGGYFRDRFEFIEPNPTRLRVLFVSPYPICPPVHGGGVFMHGAVRSLGPLVDLHVIAMVDNPQQMQAHAAILDCTASVEFIVRREGQPKGIGAITPFAVREFRDMELEWLIHRQIFNHKIHAVQLEYTQLGQYAGPYRRLVWTLFEHDVYFQSVGRILKSLGPAGKLSGFVEYLRALRYELKLLPTLDEVQTCTEENTRHVLSFLPELEGRIHHDLRAGIDTSAYPFVCAPRRGKTLLFLGSFRHLPNRTALAWFLAEVMPRVLREEPAARLKVIGSDPPEAHTIPDCGGAVELIGFVADILRPFAECDVFVCPILSGSGVRVKLLEAFASGIPCVSTRIGAEGLATEDGLYCRLADDPEGFAAGIVALLRDPEEAASMAARARRFVVERHDANAMSRRLEAVYRQILAHKAAANPRA